MDDNILTIIQDIIEVDEEKEYVNIPSRKKSSVTNVGKSDHIGLIRMNSCEAPNN